MKEKGKVRPLNLRNFPDDLYWLAKQCAAYNRQSLKAYIISAVETATKRDSPELGRQKQDRKVN
jgi:hypothetical protein